MLQEYIDLAKNVTEVVIETSGSKYKNKNKKNGEQKMNQRKMNQKKMNQKKNNNRNKVKP